jgi:hypothetical protein
MQIAHADVHGGVKKFERRAGTRFMTSIGTSFRKVIAQR